MGTNDKVFMSNQLACMLPPLALKVMHYIICWQSQAVIKYYEKQWSKFLKLSPQELEVALQTLCDNNLISISKIDGTYCIDIERDTVRKYFSVDLKIIAEHEGLKLSSNVTWNKSDNESRPSSDIEDMTTEQLQSMILRLQATVNERQQVEKLVTMASAPLNKNNDLPF